jgi:hypothetical protein
MANQKISDLTPVESLTDSDIFPVVQTKDYQSVTKSTTLGKLKNSVLSGASIRYPNGNIALSTANNELDFNDSNQTQVVSITPSLLNVTHPHTNLSLNASYVDTTVTPNVNYASCLELQDKGFRFSRQATNATTGVLTGAWQLRMASGDSYFYGGKDIEIKAGALSLDSESQVSDLGNGDIHLFAGGKLIGGSKSALSMESYTRVDIDSAYLTSTAAPTTVGTVTTQVKTYTKSWLAFDKNGATIAYGPASVSTATDSSKPSLAPTVITTPSPICSIGLSSSGTVLTSPAVTINTDNFQVKSKNGASVLFNTGTVTNLVSTVANKVDKVTGKGLSTNDFTNDLLTKVNAVNTLTAQDSTIHFVSKPNGPSFVRDGNKVYIPLVADSTRNFNPNTFDGFVSFYIGELVDKAGTTPTVNFGEEQLCFQYTASDGSICYPIIYQNTHGIFSGNEPAKIKDVWGRQCLAYFAPGWIRGCSLVGITRFASSKDLTDAASIEWNVIGCANGSLVLTDAISSRTIAAPLYPQTGMTCKLMITQSATAMYPNVSWNSVFKFPGNVAPAINTAANSVTLLEFYYDGSFFRLTNLVKY